MQPYPGPIHSSSHQEPAVALEIPPPPIPPALALARQSQPVEPLVSLAGDPLATEVTVLLGETVVDLQHLSPQQPQPARLAAGLGIAGMLLTIVAGLLVVFSQWGLGALLLPVGIGLSVLSAHHRRRHTPTNYSVGEALDADLHLCDQAIPAGSFPLLQAMGDHHLFNFTKEMKGEIFCAGSSMPLQQLAQSNSVCSGPLPGSFSYRITPEACIQITLGEATLLINPISMPQPLVQRPLSGVDWAHQRFNGVSFAAHVAVLLMVFMVPPGASGLTLGMFDVDNRRISSRLAAPQLQVETDHWLKKQRQEQRPKAGKAGQAHRGEAGRAGNKKSRARNRRMAVRGNAANPQLGRKLAEQTVAAMDIPSLFGGKPGSRIASILGGDRVLGDAAVDALGNLLGNQVGDAYGVNGLAVLGDGRGGGDPNGGEWYGLGGPMGTLGKGGRDPNGVSYGSCRGGRCGKLRAHRTGGPKIRPRVTVKGSLDKSIIRRVVRRHLNQVRYCYQRELQTNPDLYGRVVVRFSIFGNGRVFTSQVQSSTLKHQGVEQCITQAVRRWLFPKPQGGGTVVVSYPFVLRAAGTG